MKKKYSHDYRSKQVGVKIVGKTRSATHFNRSSEGTLHFSVDVSGRKKLFDMILNGGTTYHFNEMKYEKLPGDLVFFIECDHIVDDMTEEISLLEFATTIQSTFKKMCTSYADCDILEACGWSMGKKKISVHVRFYNHIVDIYTARRLTNDIKEKIPNETIARSIDLQPILSPVVQLRLPFCGKPNEERPLRYLGTLRHNGWLQKHYNEDVLRRSSICAEVPMERLYTPVHIVHFMCTFTVSKSLKKKDGEVRVVCDLGDEEVCRRTECRHFLNRYTDTVHHCTQKKDTWKLQ